MYHYFYLTDGQQLKRLEIHSFDEAVWKQELLHTASEHLNCDTFVDWEIPIKIINAYTLIQQFHLGGFTL